jgi:hypothetical protein
MRRLRLRLAPGRASPSLALRHPSVWISQLGLHTTQCQFHGRRYPSVSGTTTEKLLVMAEGLWEPDLYIPFLARFCNRVPTIPGLACLVMFMQVARKPFRDHLLDSLQHRRPGRVLGLGRNRRRHASPPCYVMAILHS